MKHWIDSNVWTGSFPFRRLAAATLDETATRLGGLGFDRVLISSFEAVFQEDSLGAEEALAREIRDRPAGPVRFHHFKIVNPTCSWWKRDLLRALDALDIAGIRLCPLYHGYPPGGAETAAVLDAADELGLPVQICCRTQD